jgi:hypothetical protein
MNVGSWEVDSKIVLWVADGIRTRRRYFIWNFPSGENRTTDRCVCCVKFQPCWFFSKGTVFKQTGRKDDYEHSMTVPVCWGPARVQARNAALNISNNLSLVGSALLFPRRPQHAGCLWRRPPGARCVVSYRYLPRLSECHEKCFRHWHGSVSKKIRYVFSACRKSVSETVVKQHQVAECFNVNYAFSTFVVAVGAYGNYCRLLPVSRHLNKGLDTRGVQNAGSQMRPLLSSLLWTSHDLRRGISPN